MFGRQPVTEGGMRARPYRERGPLGRRRAARAAAVEREEEVGPTRGRGTVVAAGAAGAVGAGIWGIGRIIRLIAGLLALVIAAGILLIALDANASNSIVSTVHDWARTLVGPFDGMFKPHDHKLAIAVNWGIALLVYLVVGSLIAGVIERLGAGARSRAALD